MDDDEFDFGSGGEDEFDFGDDDGGDGGDSGFGEASLEDMIHSNFIAAKSKLNDRDYKGAMESFGEVVSVDETLEVCDRTKWGFKANQQLAVLCFTLSQQQTCDDPDRYLSESVEHYKKAMDCLRRSKTFSVKEKNILNPLDSLANHPQSDEIVNMTLDVVRFSLSFSFSFFFFLFLFFFPCPTILFKPQSS